MLSDVSADDTSRQIHDSAKAIRAKVLKLIKDTGYEEKKKTGKSNNKSTKNCELFYSSTLQSL